MVGEEGFRLLLGGGDPTTIGGEEGLALVVGGDGLAFAELHFLGDQLLTQVDVDDVAVLAGVEVAYCVLVLFILPIDFFIALPSNHH